MSATLQAVAIARAQFEAHLAAVGVEADWRRRSSLAPGNDSAISAAAGRPDPAEGWQRDLDNPAKFTSQGPLLVLKDVPAAQAEVDAGMLLTGTAMAQVTVDSEVAVGDVLLIEDVAWYVTGARLVSPPIYRELTLRR